MKKDNGIESTLCAGICRSCTIPANIALALVLLFVFVPPVFSGQTGRFVQPPPQVEQQVPSEVTVLTPVPPVPHSSMGSITLDSLEAEFHQNRKIIHVKGKITNISRSFIRGYLTLHILSSSGTSLYSTDLPLNDHQPFGDGESVTFDTTVNIESLSGASKVSLDFTRD